MPERFLGVGVPLARQLLLASRWFDAVSRQRLAERGWPPLSAAQTLLFAQLWPGDITVADLARRLGNSRQATHEMVRGLVALEFLELVANPRRRGGRLVRLTPRGLDLFAESAAVLGEIEASLDPQHTHALRTALDALALDARDLS